MTNTYALDQHFDLDGFNNYMMVGLGVLAAAAVTLFAFCPHCL